MTPERLKQLRDVSHDGTSYTWSNADMREAVDEIDRLASLVPAAKEATPAAVPEGVRGFIAGDGGTHLWIGDEKYIKVSGDWSHIGTDRDFEECLKFWKLRSGKACILSGSKLATAYADWWKGQGAT